MAAEWQGCAATLPGAGMPHGQVAESEGCEMSRTTEEMINDPQTGDHLVRRDKPGRKVILTFTDATGQQCLHYTETHCISVEQWKQWAKRTGAHK